MRYRSTIFVYADTIWAIVSLYFCSLLEYESTVLLIESWMNIDHLCSLILVHPFSLSLYLLFREHLVMWFMFSRNNLPISLFFSWLLSAAHVLSFCYLLLLSFSFCYHINYTKKGFQQSSSHSIMTFCHLSKVKFTK